MQVQRQRRLESAALTVGAARPLLALALAAACGIASAQASYTASLMSDYRYRGVSLSGERPSASLSANMDFASGAYAGLSVAKARMRYTRVESQVSSYAGFARRVGERFAWDVGVVDTRYGGGARYNYQEAYAGISADRVAARVSVSPHYFGVGRRSVYTEVNGSYPLSDSVDVFGHAGYLRRDGGRMDYKVGVSKALEMWSVQLAYVGAREQALYPALAQDRAKRVVLTTTVSF